MLKKEMMRVELNTKEHDVRREILHERKAKPGVAQAAAASKRRRDGEDHFKLVDAALDTEAKAAREDELSNYNIWYAAW
jgi:hypothetical protein